MVKKKSNIFFGLTYIATGKATNGKYFMSLTIIPVADSCPPVHKHLYENESFYIIQGSLTLSYIFLSK